jgi:hypothetical protein
MKDQTMQERQATRCTDAVDTLTRTLTILSAALIKLRATYPRFCPTIIFDEISFLIPSKSDSPVEASTKQLMWDKLQVASSLHGNDSSKPAEFWFVTSSADFFRQLKFRSFFQCYYFYV